MSNCKYNYRPLYISLMLRWCKIVCSCIKNVHDQSLLFTFKCSKPYPCMFWIACVSNQRPCIQNVCCNSIAFQAHLKNVLGLLPTCSPACALITLTCYGSLLHVKHWNKIANGTVTVAKKKITAVLCCQKKQCSITIYNLKNSGSCSINISVKHYKLYYLQQHW